MRVRSEQKRSEEKKGKLEKPANHYKSPDDIVKDKDLSPAEKKQALNTWEQDARQMLTASNEGMEGDQEGLDRRDSHRLGEVVRAPRKRSAQSQSTSTRTSVLIPKFASLCRSLVRELRNRRTLATY
jgi:hypothetical protein